MDETIKQVDDVLWKELALEVVDQASKSDEVTDRPDVLLILEGVRARILCGQKELVEIFPEDTGDPVIEQIRQEISMMMDAGKDMAQEEEMMMREIIGAGGALPDDSMIGRIDRDSRDLLSEEEMRELIFLAHQGSKEAVSLLVEKNQGLVASVARYYHRPEVLFEDLVQEGNIGLIKGIGLFDFSRDVKFSTYVFGWIRHYILRFVQNTCRTVRIPCYMQTGIKRFSDHMTLFRNQHGRDPFDEEIISQFEMTKEQLEKMKRKLYLQKREVSLDDEVGDGEGRVQRRHERYGESDRRFADYLDERARKQFLEKFRRRFFEKCDTDKKAAKAERLWTIFLARFGFNDERQVYTLEKIGVQFGVTRERIRQLEEEVLRFIRNREDLMGDLNEILE